MDQVSIGAYLAQRLEEAGIADYFAIPGDFNLTLLDQMLKRPGLRMLNCCNELNAGYAAEGYARARGAAALVVTFGVGGLSAVNAVAGAFAEELPVIIVSGGPNFRSLVEHRVLHHTLGLAEDGGRFAQAVFRTITARAAVVRNPATAALHIDEAIRTALAERRPVYLEIACNVAAAPISRPGPLALAPARPSDPESLGAALDHAAAFLGRARQPVLVAGSRLRAGGLAGFAALAAASGYGVACMPNAKGFFPEDSPQFLGIYWGGASTPGCREVVESGDAYLFAGPVFSDYTTVGFTALIQPARLVLADRDRIVVEGRSYHGIQLDAFLAGLAGRLAPNGAAVEAFRRIQGEVPGPVAGPAAGAPLSTRRLFQHLQGFLDERSTLVAETGDAWFQAMDLRLPAGARFEIQMQYGSIGWSVGALLGLAAAEPGRRVVGLVGDGSFQMTAQELSTLLRYRLPATLVLLNNQGYTIEKVLHEGPYNDVQPWRYPAFAEAVRGDAPLLARTVRTEAELAAALDQARGFEGLALIEAVLDPHDCSRTLLGWGTAVAEYNAGGGPG
jgi:TPP-dependent 2-oxoacid decarboxylase